MFNWHFWTPGIIRFANIRPFFANQQIFALRSRAVWSVTSSLIYDIIIIIIRLYLVFSLHPAGVHIGLPGLPRQLLWTADQCQIDRLDSITALCHGPEAQTIKLHAAAIDPRQSAGYARTHTSRDRGSWWDQALRETELYPQTHLTEEDLLRIGRLDVQRVDVIPVKTFSFSITACPH